MPYQYRGRSAEVRYTSKVVEIYLNNQRIALHRRDYKKFGYTTEENHMPPGHKYMNDWNAKKFMNWGMRIGEHVFHVIEAILCRKQHPEQGYKVCPGILNLEKKHGKERLNNACKRALYYDHLSYKMIKNILRALLKTTYFAQVILITTDNIRVYRSANTESISY